MKELLEVELIGDPYIIVRDIVPSDDEKTAEDKNRLPFMTQTSALIKIHYVDKHGKETNKIISNPTVYKYDGATIPFKIGKGNMKLLIPALFHDLMCEDKSRINYNRRLSSLIFLDLLLQCKVNKFWAYFMFFWVEWFQKKQKGWSIS